MAQMAKIAQNGQKMAVSSNCQKKVLAYTNYVNLFCGKEVAQKSSPKKPQSTSWLFLAIT